MADYAIPKSGVAYILYTGLVSQADTKLLQSNPTIAAGDFQVSIDGGAFANLATLPTNTPGGTSVKISLSAAEMAGDNIVVACIDAAGAEWCDQYINIQTSPVGLNDVATAVWSVGTRTLTSFGTLVADVTSAVWAAGSRTLTAFGFTPTPSNAADTTQILANTNSMLASENAHWTWIDPTNGTPGGDGSAGDPVQTLTQAVAIGNVNIAFVPRGTGSYNCEVLTIPGGGILNLNGWRLLNVHNSTFQVNVLSDKPGSGLFAPGGSAANATLRGGGRIKNIEIVCSATHCFEINYGYFEYVVFDGSTIGSFPGGKLIVTATNDQSVFYGCSFGRSSFPFNFDLSSATSAAVLKFVGCYGDMQVAGLEAGQIIEHYGWGKLTLAASCTGGTVRHTSHVEITDNSGGAVTLDLVSEETGLTPADVNAEMLDVLTVDTFPEESAVPPATTSLLKKINWLYMWLRNKSTETATQRKLYADDTTTVVSTEAITDDNVTFTKGEAS